MHKIIFKSNKILHKIIFKSNKILLKFMKPKEKQMFSKVYKICKKICLRFVVSSLGARPLEREAVLTTTCQAQGTLPSLYDSLPNEQLRLPHLQNYHKIINIFEL